jgi:ATP-dependent Clp protease ATP-binding subunit ClpC
MHLIVDLQMQEIRKRLEENGILVELSEVARDWLANEGFDPSFGARPLRRALQRHVESPLSVQLLRGDFEKGGTVLVDVDAESNTIVFKSTTNGIPVDIPKKVDSE